MRLFKNGIESKYILLVIGILAVSGIAIATTDPIIGDNINYLDALNITRWIRATQFIDNDNPTYYIDPASSTTSANLNGGINIGVSNSRTNFSRGFAVTGEHDMSLEGGAGLFVVFDGTIPDMFGYNYSNSTATGIKMSQIRNTDGTDDIACFDPTTKEITKNTGSWNTCVGSAEKYKENIRKLDDTQVSNKFSDLNPLIYNRKDDKKHLDEFGLSANEVSLIYPQVIYTRYQGNGTFVKVILNQTTGKGESILYSDGTVSSIEGINYDAFVPLLINQIQNQQFLIETQTSQIRNICTNQPALCS